MECLEIAQYEGTLPHEVTYMCINVYVQCLEPSARGYKSMMSLQDRGLPKCNDVQGSALVCIHAKGGPLFVSASDTIVGTRFKLMFFKQAFQRQCKKESMARSKS